MSANHVKNKEVEESKEINENIDENFDLDETEEFWEIQKLDMSVMKVNQNYIKSIDYRCFPMRDNQELKKNYKYVNMP